MQYVLPPTGVSEKYVLFEHVAALNICFCRKHFVVRFGSFICKFLPKHKKALFSPCKLYTITLLKSRLKSYLAKVSVTITQPRGKQCRTGSKLWSKFGFFQKQTIIFLISSAKLWLRKQRRFPRKAALAFRGKQKKERNRYEEQQPDQCSPG